MKSFIKSPFRPIHIIVVLFLLLVSVITTAAQEPPCPVPPPWPADEARSVYNEIVRQYRDPALLEYVGDSAIQANVFPIPPGESRKVEISYSQVLTVDNGLLHYIYPLKVTNLLSKNPVDNMSVK